MTKKLRILCYTLILMFTFVSFVLTLNEIDEEEDA